MPQQNFGAALRSAFFLGASGVLTCRRNSAPLSAVVSKASAGAMELMPVHSCRSLPQTLGEARERGWAIVGASQQRCCRHPFLLPPSLRANREAALNQSLLP